MAQQVQWSSSYGDHVRRGQACGTDKGQEEQKGEQAAAAGNEVPGAEVRSLCGSHTGDHTAGSAGQRPQSSGSQGSDRAGRWQQGQGRTHS